MKLPIRTALCCGLAFAAIGCAKFPASPGAQNTHLIFTMTVAGHIKDGSVSGETPYIYVVAINPSTDLFPTTQGPIPVTTRPWGNGYFAGGATHFVIYALGQLAPYTVYKFNSPDNIAFGATGVPVSTLDPGPNGTTIQFELDLSQITPTGGVPADLQSIQVNFFTMNRRPTGDDPGTKIWDALGNGADPNSVNDFVRIPLTTSRIYSNTDFQDLEIPGDVPDPDLDIVNWSVEVRRP